MKIRLWCALALLALSTTARAEPASDASIERLMALTQVERSVEGMYGHLDQMSRNTAFEVAGRQLTPDEQARFDARREKMMAGVRDEISWARMKPTYLKLYRDAFSEEEVRGAIAFYESPAGQAFLQKMPAVMEGAMTMGRQAVQRLAPRIRSQIQFMIAEVRAGR
jgi:hypothetical protein